MMDNWLRLIYQFVLFATKEDKRSRLALLFFSHTWPHRLGTSADKLTGLIISDHRITCSREYGLPLGDFPSTARYFQSLAFSRSSSSLLVIFSIAANGGG